MSSPDPEKVKEALKAIDRDAFLSRVNRKTIAEVLRSWLAGSDIQWCEEHKSREGHEGLCEWMLVEDRWNAYGVEDCRVVTRRLSGGTE